MAVLCYLGGSVLIAAGLIDVLLTVLHYDEPGLIAARSYRIMWRVVRQLSARLPASPRSRIRSMAAPLMVVSSIAGWLGAQMFGFALLYLPEIGDRRSFNFGSMHAGFGGALYLSAANLTSLSFSDAEPKTLLYHWLSAAETIVGLALLTLTISYLLGLYQVLQHQSALVARLQHQSRGAGDPRALLEPHFRRGEPVEVSELVRDMHENLTEHYVGMRRYPIVYYFHTREVHRSIPYIFWFIGASAAALRWGLPDGHPASEDPWLPALVAGFDDVREKVARRFLIVQPEPPGEPVSFKRFSSLCQGAGEVGGDERAETFVDLERFMRRLADIEGSPDLTEVYRRYLEWHDHSGRGKAFIAAASRDLGLEPDSLYQGIENRGRG